MKKGFFSFLLMVILINPLFANGLTPAGDTKWDVKVTKDNVPQGDVEDFFERIKNACANPDEAGNQLPPESVMISCLRGTYLWGVAPASQSVDLPNLCWLDTWVYCDKDLGSMSERFDTTEGCNEHDQVNPQLRAKGDADTDVVDCPKFYKFIYFELATKHGMTCDEVKDIETVEGYCKKILAEEDSVVWQDGTGDTVDLCAERPETGLPPDLGEPPTEPEPADCSGDTFPPPEACCNGATQPMNVPLCNKACNSIPVDLLDNYKYCCDGTVPGEEVSIPGEEPLPAICYAKPEKLMSVKK